MEQKMLSELTIAEGRSLYHGVNSILTHFHIIYDPYLHPGRFTIIRIPCDCIYWKIPWIYHGIHILYQSISQDILQ